MRQAGYFGLCSEPQTLPNYTSFTIGGSSLFVDVLKLAGHFPFLFKISYCCKEYLPFFNLLNM